MRILFNGVLLRRAVSGVEISIHRLACALAERGTDEYHLIFPPCRPPLPHARPQVHVRIAPAFTAWRGGRILWEQTVLPGLAASLGCDLVHAPAYVAPLLCRTPVVLTVYDLIALKSPRLCRPENAIHYRLLMPLSLCKADGIIVPSARTAQDILSRFPRLEGRLAIIPLGLGEEFRPLREPARLARVRERLRLPSRFILFVGRLEPKKNLTALVESFARLKTSSTFPHRLVLAGPEGWGMRALSRRIRALGLEGDVVLPGLIPQEDLPVLYNLADLFVFPSLDEGFGLPPLEAQACGVPVVCSNRGALPETVGRGAWLVDPDAPERLAEAMRQGIEDAALRSRLIQAGLANAGRFSWAETARQTEAFYRTTLARARSRRSRR